MKVTSKSLVSLLSFLSVFVFTVSAKGQDIKAYKKEKKDDAETALEQYLESLNRGPKIKLDVPGDPPPPPDSNGGGDGRGSSRVVFFVSPPLANGDHEIVVPLERYENGGWGGLNNLFTGFDLRAEPQPGIRIDGAAFIEGPEDRPVGCFFMASLTGADVIPRPIFYGEFFQKPVPRVTAILCSSVAYELYVNRERYNFGNDEEEN